MSLIVCEENAYILHRDTTNTCQSKLRVDVAEPTCVSANFSTQDFLSISN